MIGGPAENVWQLKRPSEGQGLSPGLRMGTRWEELSISVKAGEKDILARA